MYMFPLTHHTCCLLLACSFPFLFPFFLLLSLSPLPPPTYSPHTEEQVRTAPRSFFVSLSSSNSCFSPSLFSLWVLVKYMLLALLPLRMLLLQVVRPTAPSAPRAHNLNFILSLRHSFSIPFFVSCSGFGFYTAFLGKRGCFHGTALPNPCSPQSSIH